VIEFNPSRLALARRRRGLSKTTLAQKTGISVRSLGYYESTVSHIPPSEEHVAILAEKLELPTEFFYGADVEEITTNAASFRSWKTLTASLRDSAITAGTFAKMVSGWIETRFNLPTPSVPSLRDFEPEAAAHVLRNEWGLGERPIPNMVHLAESHGVRVFSLPVDSHKVDAFSVMDGDVPFIFLNTKKSAEHSRFDVAHELGHLTLHTHTHGPSGTRVAEHQANTFASAFLMPRGDVLGNIPPPSTITVNAIHSLKKRWVVSAIALVFRLHRLNVLTDWHYRQLCIQLSATHYRSGEADGMARETSQVFAKVFKSLREDGITRGKIARDLLITPTDVDSVLTGLIIASVPKSLGEPEAPPTPALRDKSHLKVVENGRTPS
jgi:Zn-dependent peptidase ImmA (M78 family)/transcriptional regulator with XRE-family HTH domain